VYDLFLGCLFFSVVLSPLAIHGVLNLMERAALRREAALAQKLAQKKDPRRAWVEPAPQQRVSSVTPSAR
jgi:hypothetical protein